MLRSVSASLKERKCSYARLAGVFVNRSCVRQLSMHTSTRTGFSGLVPCLALLAGVLLPGAVLRAQGSSQTSTGFTQVVRRAQPQIVWNPSPTMTVGDPLSELELNASASVPGVFRYTPATSTLLPVGVHPLQLVFTPDNPNFAETSRFTQIQVVPDNGASFTLDLVPGTAKVSRTGQFAFVTLRLGVTPNGILMRSVHLSCNAVGEVVCSLTPRDFRPGANVATVQCNLRAPNTFVNHAAAMFALCPILGLSLLLRKRTFREMVYILAALSVCTGIEGCGSPNPRIILITATSTTESHSVTFDLAKLLEGVR